MTRAGGMQPQTDTSADATSVVSDFSKLVSRIEFGMRAEVDILAMEWKDSMVYLA